VIKQGLYDIGLTDLAARKDEPGSYNIVAALPSLHAAWPVIALLVIRKHRLPRWLFVSQALLVLGVVFAIVYTGEHYLVDAVVGCVYAFAAWWLLHAALRSGRRHQDS
jgi:membrane-associated phospholipid phosphatase